MGLVSTPRSWSTGDFVTASLMNTEVRDPLTNLQAAWSTYTATWTTSGTAVTIGTGGQQSGRYLQVGKIVTGNVVLGAGSSGFAAGTGFYIVALPVAASTVYANRRMGWFTYYHAATGFIWTGWFQILNSTQATMAYVATQGSGTLNVGAAQPVAALVNDEWQIWFTYEAA